MIKKKLIIVILIFIVFSCGKDENEKIQVDDVTEIEEEIESFDELPIKAIDFDISLPTDSNINIEDLTISTLVDEVTSMSSGSLNIFESDGFELVFIENSEGTILLYSLVKTSETNLVIINAESTALSLIMMHPWAMNFTPKAKQEMMSYVKGLDLFDTFVNEVEVGINGQDFGNLNIDFIVDAVVDNLKTGSNLLMKMAKFKMKHTN
jgi:predicted regulator of Ras-like GTPase activity (Roadblock/LC7/MglB family)